jgi:hypothetical protein
MGKHDALQIAANPNVMCMNDKLAEAHAGSKRRSEGLPSRSGGIVGIRKLHRIHPEKSACRKLTARGRKTISTRGGWNTMKAGGGL